MTTLRTYILLGLLSLGTSHKVGAEAAVDPTLPAGVEVQDGTATEEPQATANEATPASQGVTSEPADLLGATLLAALHHNLQQAIDGEAPPPMVQQEDNYLPRRYAQEQELFGLPSLSAYLLPHHFGKGGWKLWEVRLLPLLMSSIFFSLTPKKRLALYAVCYVVCGLALRIYLAYAYKEQSHTLHTLLQAQLTGDPTHQSPLLLVKRTEEGPHFVLVAVEDARATKGTLAFIFAPYVDPQEQHAQGQEEDPLLGAELVCTLQVRPDDPVAPNLTLAWQHEDPSRTLPAPRAFHLAIVPPKGKVQEGAMCSLSLVAADNLRESYLFTLPCPSLASTGGGVETLADPTLPAGVEVQDGTATEEPQATANEATPASQGVTSEPADLLGATLLAALHHNLQQAIDGEAPPPMVQQEDNYLPRRYAQEQSFLGMPSPLVYCFPAYLGKGGWKLWGAHLLCSKVISLVLQRWNFFFLSSYLSQTSHQYLYETTICIVTYLMIRYLAGMCLYYYFFPRAYKEQLYTLHTLLQTQLTGDPTHHSKAPILLMKRAGEGPHFMLVAVEDDRLAEGTLVLVFAPYVNPLVRWERQREHGQEEDLLFGAQLVCTLQLRPKDPATPNLTLAWRHEDPSRTLPAPRAFHLAIVPPKGKEQEEAVCSLSLVESDDPRQSYLLTLPCAPPTAEEEAEALPSPAQPPIVEMLRQLTDRSQDGPVVTHMPIVALSSKKLGQGDIPPATAEVTLAQGVKEEVLLPAAVAAKTQVEQEGGAEEVLAEDATLLAHEGKALPEEEVLLPAAVTAKTQVEQEGDAEEVLAEDATLLAHEGKALPEEETTPTETQEEQEATPKQKLTPEVKAKLKAKVRLYLWGEVA